MVQKQQNQPNPPTQPNPVTHSKLMSYMSNPHSFTLKKWFATLLRKSYTSDNDVIIERVASSLATNQDVEDFGKLMGALYESGYQRAVEDVKGQVEKHGLQVDIKTIKLDINEEAN